MNKLCVGLFAGGELEPGVFHLVDTPLNPGGQVRVDEEPDPAVPTATVGRVLDIATESLEH